MNLKECYAVMNSDYDEVMARLPREASVIKFLRKFAIDTEFSKMLEAFEQKNYEVVFSTTHNLKGVCGNLSLKPLAKACSEICEEVRHGAPKEDITPMVEAARQQHACVIAAIAELED